MYTKNYESWEIIIYFFLVKAEITTRQLLSHTSGIRSYYLKRPKTEQKKEVKKQSKEAEDVVNKVSTADILADVAQMKPPQTNEEFHRYVTERRKRMSPLLNSKVFEEEKKARKRAAQKEADLYEFYIDKPFKSTKEAVELFKHDELQFLPGKCTQTFFSSM